MISSDGDPRNALYREVYLLAVLDHRRREAAHPRFPGPSYPTTKREVAQVWQPLIHQGLVELVLHPTLAVVITDSGQKRLEKGAPRKIELKRPGGVRAQNVQSQSK